MSQRSVARVRRYVAGLVRDHRRRIGSRWRALPSERQALLVLVHLRRNETFPALAAAFGVGLATAHRYVTEVIELLAALAPDLRAAMRIAARKAFVILDGTLVPIDRLAGADDRRVYSGKHRLAATFVTGPGRTSWVLEVIATPDPEGCCSDPGASRTADSRICRNTRSFDCCDELSEERGGGLPAEDLAWAVVELGGDVGEVLGGVDGQVGALGKVLAQ
ncbi:transposase family protein [Actinomadura sp. KC216]|nr:transposase family protein [Actinomadura sp. KC216]